MDFKTKSKLETKSKEELIEIICDLCKNPDADKMLKLLINHSKKDIERELSSFVRWCNSAANNPCSERAVNGVYTSASFLFKALDFTDAKASAYILYQMCEAVVELLEFNDEIYDIYVDCKYELARIVQENPELFSVQELKKYKEIVDDE